MSYFADLTVYSYTPGDHGGVFDIGWFDAAYPFECGETSFVDVVLHPLKVGKDAH